MIQILESEFIKYRRTFIRKCLFLAPFFFVLIAIPQKLFMPKDYFRPWELLIGMVYNWWPILFVPIGIALFSSLVTSQEKRAGNYQFVIARNVSPIAIWISKIIVMSIHLLFTTFILMLSILLAGWITASGEIPWGKIFVGGILIWITSLTLIPLHLWIASWLGTFTNMVIGVVGLILGVIGAAQSYWIYIPWSWPTRLMCPVIGIHPNGTFLDPSSPLHDSSVILMGIIVSCTCTIILSLATAIWFQSREVKS